MRERPSSEGEATPQSPVWPRVGFVGPMVGRNPGWAPTQGEILADRFVAAGWTVRETSSRLGRPARLVDTVRSLVRWRREVDVVVVSVFSGPAFVMADISSALARCFGLPTVLWLHGGNLPAYRRRHPRRVRRVLRRGVTVVSPSPYLADDAREAVATVEVVPNLIDLAALPHRRRRDLEPRFLWMRTFHPIYNPTMAVEAFADVQQALPAARLTMAGQDKGSAPEIALLVTRLGLEASVDLPGFLDADAKHHALESHDLYLHTNDVDNTPVSVLEAAATGLPIVATEVGGIPHLLTHEETALLVPPGDAAAMADAVARLLGDPDLAERLSDGGRALAERSSGTVVQARWEELLTRAAAGGRAR